MAFANAHCQGLSVRVRPPAPGCVDSEEMYAVLRLQGRASTTAERHVRSGRALSAALIAQRDRGGRVLNAERVEMSRLSQHEV